MAVRTPADPLVDALRDAEDARERKQAAIDRVAILVADRRDDGDSVRALAQQYGVPASSIHTWTQRGRTLRESGARPSTRRMDPRAPTLRLPVWSQWAYVFAVPLLVVLMVVLVVLEAIHIGG